MDAHAFDLLAELIALEGVDGFAARRVVAGERCPACGAPRDAP